MALYTCYLVIHGFFYVSSGLLLLQFAAVFSCFFVYCFWCAATGGGAAAAAAAAAAARAGGLICCRDNVEGWRDMFYLVSWLRLIWVWVGSGLGWVRIGSA